MKRLIIAIVLTMAVIAPAVPAQAAPSIPPLPTGAYEQRAIKRTWLRAFYDQPRWRERLICDSWDDNWKKASRPFIRITMRRYSAADAGRGIVKAFLSACGMPDSYGDV